MLCLVYSNNNKKSTLKIYLVYHRQLLRVENYNIITDYLE